MKKELTANILALYLGCEVETPEGLAKMCAVSELGFCAVLFATEIRKFAINQITPTLRPLSDMTEEEAREIYRMDFGSEFEVKDWMEENPALEWIRGDNEVYREEIDIFIGSPEIWAYLLSRGFDLFGLIEAGLAKDKTKI